jgi:pimeloyl-ACP methyl ester carboxylesterase
MESHTWLDKTVFPFKEHYLQVEGGVIHYLDEGYGPTLFFVHGTPAWSFLWRNQIKELSKQYRCIAIDHLGFGLSDKPPHFPYSLEAHSQNLGKLVEYLGLKDLTLLVHDFGGPIGLDWATKAPEKVARLIVFNSWMWPLTDVKPMMQASKIVSSWLGRLLYIKFNLSPRFLLPEAFYRKEKLSKQIHAHYLGPFQKEEQRWGLWYFAKALAGETAFFQELYIRRKTLEGKPALLIWGTKDKLIPVSFLDKWQAIWPHAKVVKLETGHFMQEEEPLVVISALEEFLRNS